MTSADKLQCLKGVLGPENSKSLYLSTNHLIRWAATTWSSPLYGQTWTGRVISMDQAGVRESLVGFLSTSSIFTNIAQKCPRVGLSYQGIYPLKQKRHWKQTAETLRPVELQHYVNICPQHPLTHQWFPNPLVVSKALWSPFPCFQNLPGDWQEPTITYSTRQSW